MASRTFKDISKHLAALVGSGTFTGMFLVYFVSGGLPSWDKLALMLGATTIMAFMGFQLGKTLSFPKPSRRRRSKQREQQERISEKKQAELQASMQQDLTDSAQEEIHALDPSARLEEVEPPPS